MTFVLMKLALSSAQRALLVLAGAMAVLFSSVSQAQGVPRIAAASDLQFALETVVTRYTRETGRQVRVTYGSSGTLATQIMQGAPFDVFMSADESLVFRLADQGLTQGRGVVYGLGRLVLFAPNGSGLALDAGLAGLADALKAGRIARFAIANPEHAPYGRAARETLITAGLWPDIQARLVLGENVSQAAQFAASGNAQGGLFALSLVMSPALAAAGRHVLIPESAHAPLRQRMALLRGAGPEAAAFYTYLQQADARALMSRYGFAQP
ncbi:MAG: molybdate ABC transporter substrate-binding protein [Pseudomonadota bacterium]